MCGENSCCYRPSSLICGSVPNKTTDVFLSCWIIFTYCCYAYWIVSAILFSLAASLMDSETLTKSIVALITSFILCIFQQMMMWAVMNMYQRIQQLEMNTIESKLINQDF